MSTVYHKINHNKHTKYISCSVKSIIFIIVLAQILQYVTILETWRKTFPLCTVREDFMPTCIQVMLTEFEFVPLITVVSIKFPLYDETPRRIYASSHSNCAKKTSMSL